MHMNMEMNLYIHRLGTRSVRIMSRRYNNEKWSLCAVKMKKVLGLRPIAPKPGDLPLDPSGVPPHTHYMGFTRNCPHIKYNSSVKCDISQGKPWRHSCSKSHFFPLVQWVNINLLFSLTFFLKILKTLSQKLILYKNSS